MNVFFYVLTNNILPIIFIVALGYIMSRRFPLDVKTLSRTNFYVFVPVFTFYLIYTTDLPDSILLVLLFAVCMLVLNYLLARLIARVRHYDISMRNAMMNALMFYNSGNIGIPLVTLVFSSVPFLINGETPFLAQALAIQVIILVVQNGTTNTLGFYIAGVGSHMSWKDALKSVLQIPTMYTIPLAFLLKYLIPYDFTQFPLWAAIKYLKEGLVPLALFTLGAQLARTKITRPSADISIAVILRLLGGPILALLLILIFHFDTFTSQVLMISSAVPTALNTALIAVERDNQPEFASQTVLYATLLSPVTLALVVYLSRLVFPM
ncbi:MAG: AEC family transporter [Firmicutes bacterium]|nr:AEC family transporter [Bacillota bacterium]